MTDLDRRIVQRGWFRSETTGLLQSVLLGFILSVAIKSVIESQGYTMQEAAEDLGLTDTKSTVTEYVVDKETTTEVERLALSQEAQVAALIGASTTLTILIRHMAGYAITKFSSRKK